MRDAAFLRLGCASILRVRRRSTSRLRAQGGFSTMNEMCLAFITYFPRTPLTDCGSKSHVGDFLRSMAVQSVEFAGQTLP